MEKILLLELIVAYLCGFKKCLGPIVNSVLLSGRTAKVPLLKQVLPLNDVTVKLNVGKLGGWKCTEYEDTRQYFAAILNDVTPPKLATIKLALYVVVAIWWTDNSDKSNTVPRVKALS